MNKSSRTLIALTILATLIPFSSHAYVGPGAGITMLGSLWGLIIAVVFVVFGLLILPIKILRNKRKKQAEAEAGNDSDQNEDRTEKD